MTRDIAAAPSLNQSNGFLVINVTSDSPAAKAGIHSGHEKVEINGNMINLGGDVVTAVDNQTVSNIGDILSYLEEQKKVGDSIDLTVIRDG